MKSTWFIRPRSRDDARVRLFCFASAGAGASMFARWQDQLPHSVEVWAAQLPGHETRLREPSLTDVGTMCDELAQGILPLLDRPFALFGHSMGALLAFETARRLRGRGKSPEVLFASGTEAPHLPQGHEELVGLSDDDFLAEMDRIYGGVPALLKEDREFRDVFLPPLRADVVAVTAYQYLEAPPLRCPIQAMGGLSDHALERETLVEWERHTTGQFGVHLFPGDHFYVNSGPAAVLSFVAAELGHVLGNAAGRERAG